MITADGLRLRVDGRTLFDDLSFDLRAGEFVAVLGPNGVGKTTLLRTLAGMRRPDVGAVRIESHGVHELHAGERARLIAHMASDDLFTDYLTVRDVVAMGRYPHHRWWEWSEAPEDRNAVSEALSAVRMESFAPRRFDTLSSGERQRVWLALGLAQEARVLLLDEPTSHLDIRVAHEILALLRAQAAGGKTVVCVLHDVNEAAEFADRILLLADGAMLALDTPEAVLTSDLLGRAYGIGMELARTASGALRAFPRG